MAWEAGVRVGVWMQAQAGAMQRAWRRWWLLRWSAALMLGWSGGLLGAALLMSSLGFAGMILGGAAVGSCVGGAQLWAFRSHPAGMPAARGWLVASLLAGGVAALPTAAVGVLALLHLSIGLLLMGAVYGLMLGAAQTTRLYPRYFERAWWWLLAWGVGGAACAPLTVTPLPFGLPICLTPGPLLFALLTGAAWLWLNRSETDVMDE